MYQSRQAQLDNSIKESRNKKIISHDINQMLRNQLLEQGIQPIIVENEETSIQDDYNFIMSQLKNITRQPKKFYDYLYRTNQINDFSQGINEFIRKKLRYKRNIPYTSLITEWEEYKSGDISITPLKDITDTRNKIISNEKNKRNKGVLSQEGKQRKQIENDFNRIKKEINARQNRLKKIKNEYVKAEMDLNFELADKLKNEIVSLTKERKDYEILLEGLQNREDHEREQLSKQVEERAKNIEDIGMRIDDLNTSYRELGDRRTKSARDQKETLDNLRKELLSDELAGFGIKRKKINIYNNKIIYPIGYRWDWR